MIVKIVKQVFQDKNHLKLALNGPAVFRLGIIVNIIIYSFKLLNKTYYIFFQVALWLTRTSMSDISNVPSLKSLVQSQTTPTEKSPKVPFIQRNHSAKSLASSVGYSCDKSGRLDPEFLDPLETDRMMASTIRKCETVVTLSGMGPKGGHGSSCTASACPSRAPTPSTVMAGDGGGKALLHHCCSSSASCSGSRKNSSFNLFARLSQENRSGRRPHAPVHYTHSVPGTATPHARSVVSEAHGYGSGCESPFPVSINLIQRRFVQQPKTP